VAAKTGMPEIRCGLCGRQRLDKLISEHGADAGLPDLKQNLAKGCPRLNYSYDDRCGVPYAQLPTMF